MTIGDEKVVASAAVAPPSAPVGVEGLDLLWLNRALLRLSTAVSDVETQGKAREQAAVVRSLRKALTQQPAAVDGARPVEVTDSMVKAACGAYVRNPRNDAERAKPGAFHDPSEHLQWHCRRMSRDRFEQFMRAALTAALAAQPGGSDNDQ